MLEMVEIELIRKKHYLEGWSIRRLSQWLEDLENRADM